MSEHLAKSGTSHFATPDCQSLGMHNRSATAHRLVQIVDTAVADAYQRGGHHLVCHPGCSQCCIGVFPIAHEDAARLREGLASLEQTDPEKSKRINERVKDSLTRLDPWV